MSGPIAKLTVLERELSVMGGFYPSGGFNPGPAMPFGYIAGLHAAGAPRLS